jgi:hypothetical protein
MRAHYRILHLYLVFDGLRDDTAIKGLSMRFLH